MSDEINGMEKANSDTEARPALSSRSDMLDHRVQVGSQTVHALGEFGQPLFDPVQTSPEGVIIALGFVRFGWPASVQHGFEVLGMPTKRDGQRLQRPLTPTPFDRVVLDLPDYRLRDQGAIREFPLTPPQRFYALVDGRGDCRPVF
ncbi:hypothetical protein [Actinopolyspora erythraea]|nr:hypothetical protein [Actinopolyspora erythraea]